MLKYRQFSVQNELNIVLHVKCTGFTGNFSLTQSIEISLCFNQIKGEFMTKVIRKQGLCIVKLN